jgi:hypothetical protein
MNEVRKITVRMVKDNPPLSPVETILSAQKTDQEERLELSYYERLANCSELLTVEKATQTCIAAIDDADKAFDRINVYFQRMEVMFECPKVSWRMRLLLQVGLTGRSYIRPC